MLKVANRRNFISAGLAGVATLLIPGCATLEPEDSEKWRTSQRPILKERAEGRWGALMKGDYEKVYSFTSPEYRAVVDLQQYRAKYGRVVDWRMARVADISYDGPTVATVSVEVTYRTSVPGLAGESIETKSLIPEKWIYRNREWWYTVN